MEHDIGAMGPNSFLVSFIYQSTEAPLNKGNLLPRTPKIDVEHVSPLLGREFCVWIRAHKVAELALWSAKVAIFVRRWRGVVVFRFLVICHSCRELRIDCRFIREEKEKRVSIASSFCNIGGGWLYKIKSLTYYVDFVARLMITALRSPPLTLFMSAPAK
jgi:hypothetical protein